MDKQVQKKIQQIVKEEYRKKLNEFKFNGKEYSLNDIKAAAMAIGLSAAVVGGLLSQLQSESNADADLAAYDQSEEGMNDRQREYDMINGTYDDSIDTDELYECIKKVVHSKLHSI